MQKPSVKSLPYLSVRIDLDPEGRIGPGKIQLLENIHQCGSISAAGRAMDMSYKRAWDLVDEVNRICRQAAVERQTGGLPPGRRRAADRRQERRRRSADPVRSLAGQTLPQDRTRRGQRGTQGVAGVAQRDRPPEKARGLSKSGCARHPSRRAQVRALQDDDLLPSW